MRYPSATFFLLLFALAMTQLIVSHFLVSEEDAPTEYPTGQEWEEHRKKAQELEKKMRECKDPLKFEELGLQHAALIEKWRLRVNPPRGKSKS